MLLLRVSETRATYSGLGMPQSGAVSALSRRIDRVDGRAATDKQKALRPEAVELALTLSIAD
jgi:hypothetical protein